MRTALALRAVERHEGFKLQAEPGEVCTTKPSGEVIHTSGLVSVDAKKGDKIIWGKPGARLQYILEKQTRRSLCWRASGFAQSFTWERLEEPEMPEALGAHDWPLRKEDNTARRASRG